MKKASDIKKLFTGTNGSETWGYLMQSDKTEEECKKEGTCFTWNLNITTLSNVVITDLLDMGFDMEDVRLILEKEKLNK